jgi:hypothetical protein
MPDGEEKKINLPTTEKEQKLYDLWKTSKNKKITLVVDGSSVEIKLCDILNCHIVKNNEDNINRSRSYVGSDNDVLDFLKDMFGM